MTTKEPQRVTTRDPKKVEAGKRLAAHSRKKREQKSKVEPMSQYYSIGFSCAFGAGAVIAVGVIGSLGYYIYRTKEGQASGEVNPTVSLQPRPQQLSSQTNKFEMD